VQSHGYYKATGVFLEGLHVPGRSEDCHSIKEAASFTQTDLCFFGSAVEAWATNGGVERPAKLPGDLF